MSQSLAKAEKKCPKIEPTIGGSTYIVPADMDWKPSQFEGIEIKVLYENKEAGKT